MASGLVVLPRIAVHRLGVVMFEHGPLVKKVGAPSTSGDDRPDRARTMMFAGAGYAAVAPDYLGLGKGPGRHPYAFARGEVTASVDLLRAARTVAAYWVTSMNRVCHLCRSPSEAFQEPYAERVKQLFGGHRDQATIARALPRTPRRLMAPAFIAWTLRPTGALLKAMRDSDAACEWRPRAPVRLYAAGGDATVPIQNAWSCRTALGGAGTTVVDLGPAVDHDGSIRLALPRILTWFQHVCPPHGAEHPLARQPAVRIGAGGGGTNTPPPARTGVSGASRLANRLKVQLN